MARTRKALFVSVAPTALGLVSTACTTSAEQQSPTEATTEISASQVDKAVTHLDDIVSTTMSKFGTPGMAVAVIQNDRVVTTRT